MFTTRIIYTQDRSYIERLVEQIKKRQRQAAEEEEQKRRDKKS